MQSPWVHCPTCRQPTAAGYACQQCGAMLPAMPLPMMHAQPQPQSTGLGAGVIILIAFGIFVVLGGVGLVGALLFLRGESSSSSSSYSGGGRGSRTYDPAIGDEVEIADSRWTVVDVKDMGGVIAATASYASGETKTTSGRFIRVHYKVVNDGKKQETLLDPPKIIDGKMREFGPMQGESEYVPVGTKTAILETLQPSMEKDFYTIIEVPSDAKDLKVVLIGLGLLGDRKNVDIEM